MLQIGPKYLLEAKTTNGYGGAEDIELKSTEIQQPNMICKHIANSVN
jgi:hypothetical protein